MCSIKREMWMSHRMEDNSELIVCANKDMFVCAVYVNSHQTEKRRARRGELCSGWLDDSPWLCIADESCLAPQLLWKPERAARQKK